MDAVLDKIIEAISNPQVQLVVAFLLEAALRFKKTEKPVSIIRAVAGVFRKVANLLTVLADLSDKVLPQKLK